MGLCDIHSCPDLERQDDDRKQYTKSLAEYVRGIPPFKSEGWGTLIWFGGQRQENRRARLEQNHCGVLERQFQAELNDTRAGTEGQDPPEVAGRDVTYGVVAIRVVEDIEEVGAELHGF